MTQEIIQMARDSGMELYGLGKDRARFVHHLEAFAKLVAEKALAEHAMREVQRLGQEIEQEPTAKYSDIVSDGGLDPRNKFDAQPQPERHELQAKGEHPAPCARHCEANAFQIVIKNLKAQLAQPQQEPVALPCCGYTDASAIKWNSFNGVVQCHNCGQTYTPPQRKPLSFNEITAIEEKVYMRTTHKGKPAFEYAHALIRAVEAAHGIKENT